MNRARLVFAATLVGVGLAAGTALAQATQAPIFTPILSGKKFVAPVKGEAPVEFTRPVTRREKEMVVTRIEVRNAATAPIARLTVDETWYDKGGATVAGGKGSINGLLQPGEVKTLVIETPYSAKMSANNYNFSHANGTVKPQRIDKMPKDPAAAQTAAKAPVKK